MTSGSWAVVIDAPEHEFTFQRQFNLTIGERNDNTVYETVRKPLFRVISQADLDQVTPTVTEGVTSTIPGESKLLYHRSIQFEEAAYAICSNYQLD